MIFKLDAAHFHLYEIKWDDVEYILSTFKGIHKKQNLLHGPATTTERIVQKFVEMSFAD